MSGRIAVTVKLSGAVTDDDISRAVDFVSSVTGGSAKVFPRSPLAPDEVMIGGHTP